MAPGLKLRMWSVMAAVVLMAAACGSTTEAEGDDGGSLLTGELQTLAGDTIDLASFQGQDVVLWFWAPW